VSVVENENATSPLSSGDFIANEKMEHRHENELYDQQA
jgi:hypothetical protein